MVPILFTASTLAALSGREVTDEVCAAVHAWVLSTIEAEIGTVPELVPSGVAAVALELGRAAVPTPGGAASTTVGPYTATYAESGMFSQAAKLTPEQRHRLLRAVGRGKAFEIDTVPTIEPADDSEDETVP